MGDMATSRGGGLVGQIGRLFERGTVAGLPEGQILQRYAVHRDDAAFEALVGRHGSTVLGVCRRLLRDPNDVEDAFQATFVILVRKAGGLRDQEALGPWLHGVAYRVASRARADAARRRRRESPDERAMALALAPAPSREELRRLLDEEILRLPDKLRLPVVLCLLEGRTYDEAAHQLRWTVGMVRGRLAVARARLRDRLIRRGEAPSAALALVEFGALAVPPGLVASAPRITASVLSGKAGASSAVALANRTMRSWLMGRIATAALAWVAAGVALGVGSMGLRLLAGPEGEAKDPPVLAGELAQEKAVAKEVRAATPKRRRGSLESEIHPITIEGRALDGDGRPVAGASIVVTDANWMRSGDAVLGRGVSGSDGRFVLRDLPLPVLPPEPGPIPKPTQGRFEVAGSAPGLAFGWHAIQSYRPEPRPADFRDPKPGLVVFSGQPIVSDLVLGPPARVRGRVVDDRGHPVVGARIQFGYIDSTRNPDGYGNWKCSAINPDDGDDLSFNGVGSLPEDVRTARTDADGRYAIESLPREAKLLTLIDQDRTLEPFFLTIATSARAFPGVRSLGHDGVLDHMFTLPQTVPILVTFADSGRPAPGVTVLAEVQMMQRAGAIATTGPEGLARLALRPGTYPLRIEPPIGMPFRVGGGFLQVRDEAPKAPLRFEISPGAVVVLEAVDADSGLGIAGVGFAFATDTSADRHDVRSRTASVDHPITDDSGRLRVVMDPGRRQFFPARVPPGSEHATKASPMLALNPGETTTARFAFGKRAEPAAEAGHPEEDEVGGRLRTLWEAQARLIRRGRVRATQSFFNGDSIPPDHLRRLLESLGPDKVPPLLDLIRETFSEAPPGSTGMLEIVVDGPRRRQEEAGADLGPRHRSAGRRLRGHLRRLRGPGDPRGRGDRSPGSARLPRRFPAGAGQGREPPQAGVTRGPRRIPPRSRDDPWRALGRSGIAPAFGQSLLLCRIIPLKLILTPRRKKARGKPPWERLVGATPMAIAGSIEGGGQVRCGARMLGRAAPRGSEGGDRSRRGGRSSRSRWPRSSRSWAIGRGAATF